MIILNLIVQPKEILLFINKSSIYSIIFSIIILFLFFGCVNNHEKKISPTEKLITAINKKDAAAVKKILLSGITFDPKNIATSNPLAQAVNNQDLALIILLMQSITDTETSPDNVRFLWDMYKDQPDLLMQKLLHYLDSHPKHQNISPLIKASENGDISTMKRLLDQRIDANVVNANGETPLEKAVEGNQIDAVKLLIKNGADVNAMDKNGTTPLMIAAKKGLVIILVILLDHGAEIAASDGKGLTALLHAIQSTQNPAALLLLKSKISATEADKALEIAKRSNNTAITSALLKQLEKETPRIQTVLGTPIPLKSGAIRNPAKKIIATTSSLPVATLTNYAKIPNPASMLESKINSLIASGSDINQLDETGQTPLMEAAKTNDDRIIIILLKHGADLNLQDSEGNTALMLASRYNCDKAIQLLLNYHVDINARNRYGSTPLIVASFYNSLAAIKELIQNGADINAVTNYNQSALIFAAYQNNLAAVKLLLDAGANTAITDIYGYTALTWAQKRGYKDVVGALK